MAGGDLPENIPGLLERWHMTLASGEPSEIEARMRRHDGEYRWFMICSNPIRDGAGQIERWCSVSTDTEERRRAEAALRMREISFRSMVDSAVNRAQGEAALRRSEARKTAILDSALDCIVTIDHEGRITEFNPAAERTFGYRRDEAVGRAPGRYHHPSVAPRAAPARDCPLPGYRRGASAGEAHGDDGGTRRRE